jgi:hypothetical protein
MDGNAITTAVTQYMAAWNEREAAARDGLLSSAGATAASMSIRTFR